MTRLGGEALPDCELRLHHLIECILSEITPPDVAIFDLLSCWSGVPYKAVTMLCVPSPLGVWSVFFIELETNYFYFVFEQLTDCTELR